MSRGTVDGNIEALLVSKSKIRMPTGKDISHLDTVDGWGPAVHDVPLCHHLRRMTQPLGFATNSSTTSCMEGPSAMMAFAKQILLYIFKLGLVWLRFAVGTGSFLCLCSFHLVELKYDMRDIPCVEKQFGNKIFKFCEFYKATFYLLRNELKVLLGLCCLYRASSVNEFKHSKSIVSEHLSKLLVYLMINIKQNKLNNAMTGFFRVNHDHPNHPAIL